jgi:transposase-like protein
VVYTIVIAINEIGGIMKTEEFQILAAELEKLTPHQRRLLVDRLHKIEHVHAVSTLIESRVLSTPVCPKCGHNHIARWGSASGLQRYRCSSCRATFNALTGTPLARLRHKEKWLEYSQQLAEGQSIRRSAKACEVHRNTTFRWRHRFLALPKEQKATNLVGIAEADETYFLESFKGKKHGMTRTAHKRGSKASKRGLSDEQIPVLICRDRTGNTSDFVLEKADKEHISAVLKPLLATDAILCSDSGKALCAAAREIGITHRPINLSAGIRVVGKVYHVQNVNAYDSRLKLWMNRFHGVATHYLANYLGWRRLIDRTHDVLSPRDVMLAALGMNGIQQLTVT